MFRVLLACVFLLNGCRRTPHFRGRAFGVFPEHSFAIKRSGVVCLVDTALLPRRMRLHHFAGSIILLVRHFDSDRVFDRAEDVAAVGAVVDDFGVDVVVAEQRGQQVGFFGFRKAAENLHGEMGSWGGV
jgi:hypothetical protein